MKRVVGAAVVTAMVSYASSVAAAGATAASQWAGLYFGVQAGYAKSAVTERYTTDDPADPWWDAGAEGGVFGAFAGYNHPLSGNMLLGAEIEGNLSSQAGQYFNSYYGGDYFNSSWSAAARLRFGFLPSPNAFLYGSVGLAVANFDYTNGYFSYPSYVPYTNPSLTLAGIQLGIGAETFISPRWSLRSEAIYTQYATGTIDFTSGTYLVNPRTLTARVGLTYHLGWMGQPMAPTASDTPMGSWTGLYAGADLGMIAVDSIEDYASGGYNPSFDSGGAAGRLGAHAGFNWQAGSMVAGLEVGADGPGPLVRYDYHPDAKQNWSAAIRGRLGFLTSPNVLVYGTAGWVASGFDYYNNYASGYVDHDAASFTANGFQFGGGVEAFIHPNLSVRVEGLYTSYGSHLLDSSGGTPDYWTAAVHTLEGRLGLSYHFN